ncbi:uncharacterized protein LOC134466120 [Engraulis encrasicolus]|uniref:uncharacterized protein LOC134466120 n=1 Tax=Engraulis encrasicolus TaxID=184585 RepID=UPI002FD11FF4
MEAGCQPVSEEQDETSIDAWTESEMIPGDVFRSMEDLRISGELAESCATDQATSGEGITSELAENVTEQATSDKELRTSSELTEGSAVDQGSGHDVRITSQSLVEKCSTTPHTYSIIFDNLDFFMHTHHQSTLHSNKSIHWIHHIAVQDRVPIYHLANDKPIGNLLDYDLNLSLPSQNEQMQMRREFIVFTSRILSSYLSVFKPFSNVVVRHIPHQYSAEMAQHSTDYPLGLLFKDENKSADLAEVLHHFQNTYVPKRPDGISTILVGGDRLSEANSRNLQWAYANGLNTEERLDGMEFMFEDWHAIRMLFQIHYKVFFSEKSAKDHGTLCANMTKLRCSNAKQGPKAAYNAYKHFVITDTTALLLTAAMEHFGLKDIEEIPESFVPEDIASGSTDTRRTWLHAKSAEVVDKYILLGDAVEAMTGLGEADVTSTQATQYPCRAPGCQQVYTYPKSRDNHELKKHNLHVSPETLPGTSLNKDHKQEHTLARLSFSFLLWDMLDAVKEGDGERLMRLYKVALLFYKAHAHSHYAYSTLLLTLQVNACLTPRMSHSVTWNRFWSTRGGNGGNIPLDLHLEHLNNFLKSFLKGQGPNLSEASASRVSKAIGVLKEIMDKVDSELGV